MRRLSRGVAAEQTGLGAERPVAFAFACVAEASKMSAGAEDWSGWRLHITDHTVHKLVGDDLIVSTLKPFSISVCLGDAEGKRVVEHDPAHLMCELLYENGQTVPEPARATFPEQQALLHGGTALLQGGKATFKLRLTVLSSQHGNRKFRLRLAAVRPEGESPLPPIQSAITEPVRTLTKLHRQPRDGGGAKRGIEDAEDEEEDGLPPSNLSKLVKGAEQAERNDAIEKLRTELEQQRDVVAQQAEAIRSQAEAIRSLTEQQAEMQAQLRAVLATAGGASASAACPAVVAMTVKQEGTEDGGE